MRDVPPTKESGKTPEELAKFLHEQVDLLAAERDALREALDAIIGNAESWHGDDAAKGRALKVIAIWAREALERHS